MLNYLGFFVLVARGVIFVIFFSLPSAYWKNDPNKAVVDLGLD